MALPKLSKLELQIMEEFWRLGPSSIREIQESLPKKGRPAYSTVQTIVYRLEAKKALSRVKKIGNAHVFEVRISRDSAHSTLIDNFLKLFGGKAQPVISHLVQTGQLTLEDIKEAEITIRQASRKDSS